MPAYGAIGRFGHDLPDRTGVLLVQLGTPDAPDAASVRAYLREFLSDPRVVEIPPLVWWPILHGIILRRRPRQSALKYASIWTPEGSPLLLHTRRQAEALRETLAARGVDVEVAFAMRYGNPSIASVLRELRERNLSRLLVVPMYPQYAGSTTATAFDAVFAELATWRNPPELRTVKHFHDDPGYIEALARSIAAGWERDGPPDRLVMSFHGVPRRTLMLGDPYHCECHVTARLLAERLGLRRDDYVVTFQSRFGRAEWLQPYTEPTLRELGRQGVGRVDVVCPGFVADCLETLEEVAMECKAAFIEAGGREYRYIECLNASPPFVDALAGVVTRQLGGWPVGADAPSPQARDAALAQRRERAVAMGAER